MAAARKPKLLLLDEHTAALDPKTAAKVLEISDKIIAEHGLTAMMVTHNMKDAIAHGNDQGFCSDRKSAKRMLQGAGLTRALLSCSIFTYI